MNICSKLVLSGFLAIVAVPASAGLVAINSSALYNVDPLTGAVSFRAMTSLSGILDLAASDIANTIYATNGTSLYSVNVNTGSSSVVGSYSGDSGRIDTLMFGPFGELYGLRDDGAGLYQINRSNAQTTFQGNHGHTNMWAAEFIPGAGPWAVGQDDLAVFRLALSNGAATQVGLTGASRITDIAYDSSADVIVAVANGPTRIYHLSEVTGAATQINSYGLYSFLGLAEFHSECPVSGSVSLGQYGPSPAGKTVHFEIRQNGVEVEAHDVVLGSSGTYSFATTKRGNLQILAKTEHWLRKASATINLTDVGATGVSLSLTNGDIEPDNVVNLGDFDQFAAAFGSEDGDANYSAMADLDGNTVVDLGDFDILAEHFGEEGD